MTCTIHGVRAAGIASAVPESVMTPRETAVLAGVEPADADKIGVSTGVLRRHVAPPWMCTSDMCFAAAEKLLGDLGWERDSVDVLIFVSQTPDYRLPATSCVLHQRLGLSKECAALDVSLGCSGYIYGLWLLSTLVASGQARRALLLVGETASVGSAPTDRAVVFLFGDAGTATALERDDSAPPMHFNLGTDGSGHPFIMVPGGAFRNPPTAETLQRTPCEDGVERCALDGRMNGPEVFAFTLREVPPLIHGVLRQASWTMEQMDAFIPHQANLFMLEYLAKRMKVPKGKLVLGLAEFGNTSSASVPLSMTHVLKDQLRSGPKNLVMAGFGVGWSWGAVAAAWGPMVISEIVLLKDAQTTNG